MSNKPWRKALQAILTQKNKRLAIVGIGHELRGDDAVGVLIARELQKELKQDNRLLILDAGVTPENITGQLRCFAPDIVLLIDAVDMGQDAGTIAMIDINSQFLEQLTSTHTLSLHIFADYLQTEFNCTVCFLGIQTMQIGFNQALSTPIQISAKHVIQCFLS